MSQPAKRPYKRRVKEDLNKNDLIHEEKVMKKKKLRTRSGRVSRPPKHMVTGELE